MWSYAQGPPGLGHGFMIWMVGTTHRQMTMTMVPPWLTKDGKYPWTETGDDEPMWVRSPPPTTCQKWQQWDHTMSSAKQKDDSWRQWPGTSMDMPRCSDSDDTCRRHHPHWSRWVTPPPHYLFSHKGRLHVSTHQPTMAEQWRRTDNDQVSNVCPLPLCLHKKQAHIAVGYVANNNGQMDRCRQCAPTNGKTQWQAKVSKVTSTHDWSCWHGIQVPCHPQWLGNQTTNNDCWSSFIVIVYFTMHHGEYPIDLPLTPPPTTTAHSSDDDKCCNTTSHHTHLPQWWNQAPRFANYGKHAQMELDDNDEWRWGSPPPSNHLFNPETRCHIAVSNVATKWRMHLSFVVVYFGTPW